MQGVPLAPEEGNATTVGIRLLPSDTRRLSWVAVRRRLSRSAMGRELLRAALDAIERAGDGGPEPPEPDG
jgi:hypothetical protein